MDITDWILDIALIAIVFRQLRESRLDVRGVLIPIGICLFVAHSYLQAFPTHAADLARVGGFTAVGVLCGLLSGFTTRVRADGGRFPLIKAGWVAAGTWVASMGFRLGFAVWASHGGDAAIARFSVEHGIDAAEAWTTALVLMALGEVFVRTAVMLVRGHRAVAAYRPAAARTLAAA